MPHPFVIDGDRASNGQAHMVCPDAAGRLFLRRAIKGVGSPQTRRVEWVVAELDGVRAYFDGTTVVLTKRDLRP